LKVPDGDRLLLLTSSGRDSPRTISNILSSLSMSILLAKLPFFLDLLGIVSERVGLLINFMLNFTTDREQSPVLIYRFIMKHLDLSA
jgi:hypothetical protein